MLGFGALGQFALGDAGIPRITAGAGTATGAASAAAVGHSRFAAAGEAQGAASAAATGAAIFAAAGDAHGAATALGAGRAIAETRHFGGTSRRFRHRVVHGDYRLPPMAPWPVIVEAAGEAHGTSSAQGVGVALLSPANDDFDWVAYDNELLILLAAAD